MSLKKQTQVDGFKKVIFRFSQNTAPGWRLSAAIAALGHKKNVNVLIIIDAGVQVGGMIIDTPAPKSKIKIENYGSIIGQRSGGHGLIVSHPVKIENLGTIAGAGGSGGNGGSGTHGGLNLARACASGPVSGGGGGAGAGMSGTVFLPASYGGGGAAASDSAARGGSGGRGGDLGVAGSAGSAGHNGNSWQGGTIDDVFYPACGPYDGGVGAPGQSGGAPGKAVTGNSFVTWVANGTIIGALA